MQKVIPKTIAVSPKLMCCSPPDRENVSPHRVGKNARHRIPTCFVCAVTLEFTPAPPRATVRPRRVFTTAQRTYPGIFVRVVVPEFTPAHAKPRTSSPGFHHGPADVTRSFVRAVVPEFTPAHAKPRTSSPDFHHGPADVSRNFRACSHAGVHSSTRKAAYVLAGFSPRLQRT